MDESGSKNEEGRDVERARSEETAAEGEPNGRRRSNRKSVSKKRKNGRRDEDPASRIDVEEESCGNAPLGERKSESGRQRSRCRQRQLNSSRSEINRCDVVESRDPASKAGGRERGRGKEDGRGRPCSERTGTCTGARSNCSEGSYSRRKHRRRREREGPDAAAGVCPKVNPVFLWVRQEETRIVEVLCEDYDHRNRLKLRRTHLGWRAIPKTKRFAEAIAAKARQSESEPTTESLNEPKKVKKVKRKRKKKSERERNGKRKHPKKVPPDNPNIVKECSVALSRDDLTAYECRISGNMADGEDDGSSEKVGRHPDENLLPSHPAAGPMEELTDAAAVFSGPARTLTKSNSCDFPTLAKPSENLHRSTSFDSNLKRDFHAWAEEEGGAGDLEGENSDVFLDLKKVAADVKSEPEKMVEPTDAFTPPEEVFSIEEPIDQRIHSEGDVMDMTKHDSDSDELGQLLKVIPDLEFVGEDELEEVDEDEWSSPTDLTLPKTSAEDTGESSGKKLPVLPINISPLVTVTSTLRPPEPLTAPLPEVTITPVPKPAHQHKPRNNFLESLLEKVKPERAEGRRASSKHFSHRHGEGESDFEIQSKRLKAEDITLKSLLSKHCPEKSAIKSAELERHLGNLSGDECPKSRLHELLTENTRSDPISQLKEVLSNPLLAVPDPLLVPRARLPALVASPASEIPRLLTMHLEKAVEEKPCPPVADPSDVLEVSLSNLQSLLSGDPEKGTPTTARDLENYQKSLEAFLGWQRYRTELMETRMKNSKAIASSSPYSAEVATATALGQMLWLPYLNQFDFDANRNVASLMNSVLASDCQMDGKLTAPPQINISQVSQPSPFLTPTSPMDVESHLKTLAMWQEAIALHQNSQATRACSKASSKTPKNQYQSAGKKTPFFGAIHRTCQEEWSKRHGQQIHFEQRPEEFQPKYKPEPQNHSRKTSGEKRKTLTGSISVKPLSNLIDKSNVAGDRKGCWQAKDGLDMTPDRVALRLQQFNTQIQRTRVKEENSPPSDRPRIQDGKGKRERPKDDPTEAPKLKVKNLVDPNISPPKLLKQMAPEQLPVVMEMEGEATTIQEDGQSHLWHPLFGSSKTKPNDRTDGRPKKKPV